MVQMKDLYVTQHGVLYRILNLCRKLRENDVLLINFRLQENVSIIYLEPECNLPQQSEFFIRQ